MFCSLYCQVVSRDSLLPSPTRDRPKPPPGRTLPSKQFLRHPGSTEEDTSFNKPVEEPVEEEAGDKETATQDDEIEAVWANEEVETEAEERPLLLSTANSMMASSTPIANSAVSTLSSVQLLLYQYSIISFFPFYLGF